MLTALSVNIPARHKGWRGWADKLRRDRVAVEEKKARGVTLRHVTYTSYSGELRLEKAAEVVGCQRSRILCSERLIFPRASGFRRFSSAAFSARLCTNFALEVLSKCQNPAALRVALYDPAAYCADYLPALLERCADVTVVTGCQEPYICAAQRALEELGASALITRNRRELQTKDLIIAPQPVAEKLEADRNCVLLTSAKPLEETGANALYHYRFRMPNGFDALKPRELSEEYFCSALYTLSAQYELGSIVPQEVCGEGLAYDAQSLAKWLDKRK